MKTPAILAAVALMSACGQTTQSVETPLVPAESLDIAATPVADDATCSRGSVDASRSFILCEDGALRETNITEALTTATDSEMSIAQLAQRYDEMAQDLPGIDAATYGNIVRKDRRPVKGGRKTPTEVGSLKMDGKTFDIYQIQNGTKTGTIFIERKKQ